MSFSIHRRASGVVAGFLGLHLLLAYGSPGCLWGGDLLRYYPVWAQGLFAVLGGALLVPGMRDRVVRGLSGMPGVLDPWADGSRAYLPHFLLVLLGGAAFVMWRSAVHLLGDGDLYVRELDAGIYRIASRSDRAPLAFWIVRELHRLGGAFWGAGETTYRVYSTVSGVVYLLGCVPAARILGRDRVERTVLLGFLLTPGFMQFFFGYVETYALLMPVLLGYLVTGVQALRGAGRLWLPVLFLGLLMALHFSQATLIPSLGMVFLGVKGRRPVGQIGKAAGYAVLPVLLAVGIVLLADRDGTVSRVFQRDAPLLPVLGAPGFWAPYRMVSVAHLLDLLNQYLLVAPAAILAVCLFRRGQAGGDPIHRFLFAAALFPVLATLVANPEIGAFRDWDVLALPALPLTLWAGMGLVRQIGDRNLLAHAGVLICGAAALHAVFWIGVNARAPAAEARFETALDRCVLSTHARSYGWETLSGHYRRQQRMDRALHAQQQALRTNPENPRLWHAVGALFREVNQPERAVEYFRKATQVKPGYAEAYDSLGNAYHDLKQPEAALAAYRKAVSLQPNFWLAHYHLGRTQQDLGDLAGAVPSLQKVVALHPNFSEAYQGLGMVYLRLGQPDSVRVYLKKVLALAPNHPQAGSMRAWLADHR